MAILLDTAPVVTTTTPRSLELQRQREHLDEVIGLTEMLDHLETHGDLSKRMFSCQELTHQGLVRRYPGYGQPHWYVTKLHTPHLSKVEWLKYRKRFDHHLVMLRNDFKLAICAATVDFVYSRPHLLNLNQLSLGEVETVAGGLRPYMTSAFRHS